MGLPKLTVVYPLDPLPDARLGAVLVPAAAQVSVIEAKHLRRQPGGHVHAIGDVADRNGIFRFARIQPRPHRPGDLAVQCGNRIGAP